MRKCQQAHIFILALFLLALQDLPGQETQRRSSRGDQSSTPDKVIVGKTAPDFELPVLDIFLKANGTTTEKKADEKEQEIRTVKLSSFKGKTPVLLVFSSYT